MKRRGLGDGIVGVQSLLDALSGIRSGLPPIPLAECSAGEPGQSFALALDVAHFACEVECLLRKRARRFTAPKSKEMCGIKDANPLDSGCVGARGVECFAHASRSILVVAALEPFAPVCGCFVEWRHPGRA